MPSIEKVLKSWLPYAPIGNQVPGTRFIAFKVPLREAFVDKLQADDRFTISVLLDRIPDLGLVVDLTHTTKYYNKREFLDRGVDYVKIQTPGQIVPPQHLVERFFEVVDYYLESHKNDNTLIGVHCTHGVNRTGYMLCRYLIQRLGYTFNEAVDVVGRSRGHGIRRQTYIRSLELHDERVAKRLVNGGKFIERALGLEKGTFMSQMRENYGLEDSYPGVYGSSNVEVPNKRPHKYKSKKKQSKSELVMEDEEDGWTKVSVRKNRHRNKKNRHAEQ